MIKLKAMKKITFLLLSLIITVSLTAQDASLEFDPIATAEVPSEVIMSHNTNFPNGFVRSWAVNRGLSATDRIPERYQAVFSDGGGTNSHTATYLPNGMLFFHSEFLDPDNIPSEILLQTRSEFDDSEVEHVHFITMFNPKREIYRVKVRDQALVEMVYYTVNGMKIPKNELPEELLVFKY
ncbi:MAG: hypothetical protein CMC75_08330 [Flavobacteriaceae bacterium]|jgi:hypothetical protein|nr:hypothetical protein [Flavobacteriaceae bacterium]|tara:strand:+ start:77 stop:619 length:543 start_codon:yes stop_codon:yes gene_type:complete